MRRLLIHVADAIDNYVLRHRVGWVCDAVALSSWWPESCGCGYCRRVGGAA